MRQLAVFVRVDGGRAALSERAATSLPGDYEGALLEGLNTRALIARDVTAIPAREQLDARAAAARAREVGADHALMVDVAVARREEMFCRNARAPFTAAAVTIAQQVTVVRASDGLVRWKPDEPVAVRNVDPDCEKPRASRVRSASETVQTAVERLLGALLAGESRR